MSAVHGTDLMHADSQKRPFALSFRKIALILTKKQRIKSSGDTTQKSGFPMT